MASDTSPDLGPSEETLARRERQAEKFRRRSERVRRWRRALPITLGVLGGGLLLWVVGRGVVANLTAPKPKTEAVVRMVNPRFYGRDAQNRAFVVSAGVAERRTAGSRSISLSDPSLTLDAEGANPTSLRARQGVYHETDRQVRLEGGVRAQDKRGYSFATPRAVIDTRAGVVTGDRGVVGQGPLGSIRASSYAITDRGRRIVFKGDVRARIEQ
ncbi:MAG TPA: LPS export ABC transporter periplasmic protein LptC [Caulobacteraceae bacterium]